MAQRLSICPPVQGTQGHSLLREDPGAAVQPSPRSLATEARRLEPLLLDKRSLRGESPHTAARARPESAAETKLS